MLLKIERKILQKTSSNFDGSISLSAIGNYNGEDVYQALLGLKDRGYFNMVDTSLDRSQFFYTLSPKGRFYKENFRLQLLKNIIIPFVVALITALATFQLEKLTDEYSTNCTSQCGYQLDNSSE